MSRPRLTLCVIARDEEALLPGCLASARGAVDRVVVVDTGSRDATREIAERAGAHVLEHAWHDDFAAARNAGLAAVRSGFVLVLDADERLAPGAGRVLRRAARQGGFDLGLLPLHDADALDAEPAAVLAGARRIGEPIWLPRLLRWTPDLRYEGSIHESVAAWAEGRRARTLDAPIVHYGAVPALREARAKGERNRRLLEARTRSEPGDPLAHAHLARELERAGDREAALRESAAAWQALGAARARGDARHEVLLPATLHAQLLLAAGRVEEAREVLATARAWLGSHPNLDFLAGVSAEQAALAAPEPEALLAEAAACYERCVRAPEAPGLGETIPGATGWQARARLATVELRRGRPREALAGFEAALALRPDLREARLGAAEARLALGESEAALAALESLVVGEEPEAWVLAAEAALRLGATDDARLFAERARAALSGGRRLAPWRRSRLHEVEQELAAAGRLPAAGGPPGRRSVLVLGAGRSGTSMAAGLLAEAGWYVGDDPHPPRDSNPKGFFETFEINGINEALLGEALPACEVLPPWRRWLTTARGELPVAMPPALARRVRALVARAPFAFKDPRFAWTLPAWRPFLPEGTGFVCVFRPPAVSARSIVQECASQEYLAGAGMDFERALCVWLATYRAILDRPREAADWLFLHYEQLLGPEGQDRLEAFVGAAVARDFPERRLSRTRSEEPVPAEVAETYAELCALAGAPAAQASVPVRGRRAARPPAAGAPELSVVVCSHERRATLARCLAAFEEQSADPGRYELVVVNDGSRDGTRELLDERRFRVRARVVHQENAGLAAARNRGIAEASGRLLLLVNDDTIAHPELVERHLEAHARHASAVAVLGSFEQPPAALDNALMRHLEGAQLVFCYGGMQAARSYDWTRFWTCNVSVPSEAVREAGGFDEAFRHYGCEDTDLGYRLWRNGVGVLYAPEARAWHEHVLDLDALERRNRTVARAFVRFFRKHPEALEHPDWRWLARLSRADCERFALERLPEAPVWRAAAGTLAAVDVGRLEAAGGKAAASAVLKGLARPLEELNRLWWHEGLAEGLAEQEIDSFAALAPPAVRRILAWPRYAGGGELDFLLREYGKQLAGRGDVQLCLLHDAADDGDPEVAIAELERAYAAHVPDAAPLDVLFWTDPLPAGGLGALARDLAASIELPASREGRRRLLLESLPVPRVRAPGELASLLAAAS